MSIITIQHQLSGVKRPQLPHLNTLPLHFHTRAVVARDVVVHGVRANLVPTHAAPRLVPAFFGNGLVLQRTEVLGHPLCQGDPGISAVGVLATLGGFDTDARGFVR